MNQEIVFSKYTILIGENNSGKSSILKFLMMLRQSLLFPRENLTLKGLLVDLRMFDEVVFMGDKNKKISFAFKF